MKYRVTIEGHEREVEVTTASGGWRVRVDDGDWRDVPGTLARGGLRFPWGGDHEFGVHVSGDQVAMQARGTALNARVIDPRRNRSALAGGAGEGEVRTPMPGVVVRIPVEVGQQVSAGQVLIVVEAMKMENEFKAATDGIVAAIEVQPGQALEADALLVRVDAE